MAKPTTKKTKKKSDVIEGAEIISNGLRDIAENAPYPMSPQLETALIDCCRALTEMADSVGTYCDRLFRLLDEKEKEDTAA